MSLVALDGPTAELRQPLQVYFGDLGVPASARAAEAATSIYTFARDAAGMDFVSVVTPGPSDALSETASRLNARTGDFVALDGWLFGPVEIGRQVAVLGGERVAETSGVPHGRFDLFYRFWLPEYVGESGEAILHFREPSDVRADYGAPVLGSVEALREATARYGRTMQIAGPRSMDDGPARSSSVDPWEAYLHYLNAGFRLAPAASWPGPTSAKPTFGYRTAVLAPALTKADLLEGVRRRRVYASEDRNLRVFFSINGHPMGAVVPVATGTPLRIEVTFSDPDEPAARYWLSLRHDVPGGPVDAATEWFGTDFPGDGRVVFTQFRRAQAAEYFLLQIRQESSEGADLLWTAPIWLERPSDER